MTPATDEPSQNLTAEAQALLDSVMPKRIDELDGMEIDVRPPDAKLIRGTKINVGNVFYHEDFEVVVRTTTQCVRFALNLSDWLREVAAYFCVGAPPRLDTLMAMGDRLKIEHEGDAFRLEVFDIDRNEAASITLTRRQFLALHGRLKAELLIAIHRATGAFAQITGLEQISIGEGDAI